MDKLKILNFSEFEKIYETSEFNLQRFNSDSVQASTQVDNPQTSLNAFDKFQDMIRLSMARINDIMHNLKGTNAYSSLRNKLALEDQDVKNIRILRMVKSETLDYDVYLTFVIGDEIYWGKIKNVMNTTPTFTSEVFKDSDLYQPKEWIIKITGLIIKTVKSWLKPEPGTYKLLNNDILCYSVETGRQLKMYEGIEIELIRAHTDKIIIRYEGDAYNLVGDNYIFFNWWFEKIK